MPVTKTAKRALRGSRAKEIVNKLTISKLEAAIRVARKTKSQDKVVKAVSLADRAAKRKVIHKNKAARIKSQMAKLMTLKTPAKTTKKKVSSKKV
ncbi:MAG TPA: 30S ribosomal protein S20 [Patescibacteria group bacterium]|nr:30S ribosomal protein S20 [Patescibacteria group bacterium]